MFLPDGGYPLGAARRPSSLTRGCAGTSLQWRALAQSPKETEAVTGGDGVHAGGERR
jgi:hypothetical protein